MQLIGLNNQLLIITLTGTVNTLPKCVIKIVMYITLMFIIKIIKIMQLILAIIKE